MGRAKPSLLISLLLIAAVVSSGSTILAAAQNCWCADLVSQQFFDGLTGQVDDNCEAKGFYTRQAFFDAWGSYSAFAEQANADDTKREIAAFFAHVSRETWHLCYKDQKDKSSAYCDNNVEQYPCAPGKMYYGRGPLQISWNYNYGPAGEEIGFDGINWPEAVSTDATISFKTALWFWMRNIHGILGQGFGATIQVINGALECGGKDPEAVSERVSLYLDYCNQFGVSPGDNLTC